MGSNTPRWWVQSLGPNFLIYICDFVIISFKRAPKLYKHQAPQNLAQSPDWGQWKEFHPPPYWLCAGWLCDLRRNPHFPICTKGMKPGESGNTAGAKRSSGYPSFTKSPNPQRPFTSPDWLRLQQPHKVSGGSRPRFPVKITEL